MVTAEARGRRRAGKAGVGSCRQGKASSGNGGAHGKSLVEVSERRVAGTQGFGGFDWLARLGGEERVVELRSGLGDKWWKIGGAVEAARGGSSGEGGTVPACACFSL